ncbi:GNAT family N-acetyltransferase [Ruegeria conchae]|uniref:Acetyltransferase (GNAT) family protein n=1 Tax=Ruegeria conchae TaxID=981384 RepID=A0A497YWW6_9RHOB|nr:acetyltransferase (GNAT) family protein [Ruegeria conchae]
MNTAYSEPTRLNRDSLVLPEVLRLIRESFAYMEGRIDPPSSMHRLTLDSLRRQIDEGEIWVIGDRPDAVVFLTPKPGRLYLSKLAVDLRQRDRGLARTLIEQAQVQARRYGLDILELQSRVELVENHATFARLGFSKTGETAHPGFDRPTSITMQKRLG